MTEYDPMQEQLAQAVRDQIAEANERLAEDFPEWKDERKREALRNQAREYGRRLGLKASDLDNVFSYQQARALIDGSRAEQTKAERQKAEDRHLNSLRENFSATKSLRNAGAVIGKLLERGRRR